MGQVERRGGVWKYWKKMFWQTVFNNHRQKLKLQVNGIEISLVDIETKYYLSKILKFRKVTSKGLYRVSRNWKVISDKVYFGSNV